MEVSGMRRPGHVCRFLHVALIFLLYETQRDGTMDDHARDVPEDEDLILFRDCFSVKYIQSAALFCRLGFAIESDYARTGILSADERLRTRRLSSMHSSLRWHF